MESILGRKFNNVSVITTAATLCGVGQEMASSTT
jgi:hypothetical protein